MGRLLLVAAAVVCAGSALTACGGSSDRTENKGHPFAGTWKSGGGAGAGAGGTTLTVDAKGGVRFKSSLDCTGTVTPAGGAYKIAVECGTTKFTGTASAPPKSGTFTVTWTDGDSTQYRSA
jgi:hypothetical protein